MAQRGKLMDEGEDVLFKFIQQKGSKKISNYGHMKKQSPLTAVSQDSLELAGTFSFSRDDEPDLDGVWGRGRSC
jgi:hypothetical protein